MSPAEEDTNPPIAWLRQMASALASRLDFANRAGITFKGKRDLYAVLGYQRSLQPSDYRERWERNGVATRIVETFPKSTWRAGGVVTDDLDPDTETPFKEAWKTLDKRLKIWPTFLNVDILAGLGEYAVLLLGVKGGKLDEPLPDKFTIEDLIYLSAFSQEDVEVSKLVTSNEDPRFGQPEEYTLTRIGSPRGATRAPASRGSAQQTVHWSRVIHVAEGLLDDKIFGKPRLRNVWNYLDDLDKVSGGGAEAFWLRANQGFIANIDKDLPLKPEDIKNIQEQVEEFAHQMRRTIGQRGIDLTTLGSDVADYSKPVDATMKLISASTGIPVRILMGSERGELASSQDKTNFDDRTDDRREQHAEPVVVRPFVDVLLDHDALPDPKEGEYLVRWPMLDTMDDTEKINTALKMSTVNKNEGETVFTIDEQREVTGREPLEEISVDEDDDDEILDDPDSVDDEDEESEPVAASGKGTP